jgi:hypothetical protein
MYVIKNDKEMKKSSQRWKDAYNKPMKKGCFSQSCYRTMTVIEVVPQQNKKTTVQHEKTSIPPPPLSMKEP